MSMGLWSGSENTGPMAPVSAVESANKQKEKAPRRGLYPLSAFGGNEICGLRADLSRKGWSKRFSVSQIRPKLGQGFTCSFWFGVSFDRKTWWQFDVREWVQDYNRARYIGACGCDFFSVLELVYNEGRLMERRAARGGTSHPRPRKQRMAFIDDGGAF